MTIDQTLILTDKEHISKLISICMNQQSALQLAYDLLPENTKDRYESAFSSLKSADNDLNALAFSENEQCLKQGIKDGNIEDIPPRRDQIIRFQQLLYDLVNKHDIRFSVTGIDLKSAENTHYVRLLLNFKLLNDEILKGCIEAEYNDTDSNFRVGMYFNASGQDVTDTRAGCGRNVWVTYNQLKSKPANILKKCSILFIDTMKYFDKHLEDYLEEHK